MTEYNLKVYFPDQSESFVLGFEAGQIYEKINNSFYNINDINIIHTKNKEVLKNIIKNFDLEIDFFRILNEDWSEYKLKFPETKLRVIK